MSSYIVFPATVHGGKFRMLNLWWCWIWIFLCFFSVKESLRGTVKRQTERSSTLRRWMLTLTWLRLTWKRYVSSQSSAAASDRVGLSFTCLTQLPGLSHSPTSHPPLYLAIFFPFFFFFFLSMLPQPWLFIPLRPKDNKDWVTMCLMPAAVCKKLALSLQHTDLVLNKADNSTESSLSLYSSHQTLCCSEWAFWCLCVCLCVLWIIHFIWLFIFPSSGNLNILFGLFVFTRPF